MKANTTAAKVAGGIAILFWVSLLFGVSYFISDNVDDSYWLVLIAGPLTIFGSALSAKLFHEYFVRTVAPNNKVMQLVVGYGLLFICCLIVFFWYAEDFQEEYFTNVVRYSFTATIIVFLGDCFGRFMMRRNENSSL